MWNSRRKEAANQALIAFIVSSGKERGYSKEYAYDTQWYTHNSQMYIQDCLRGGANVDCADGLGNTPLIHAVAGKMTDIATSLVTRFGANPDTPNNYGDTPLIIAVTSGQAGLAQELLLAGAKAAHKNHAGDTAASLAAKSTDKAMTDLLPYLKGEKPLEDIKAQRKKQQLDEDLLRVVRQGRPEDIKWAIEHGADVNAANAKGQTALMLAYGSAAADTLIAYNAKVDTQDNEGRTALSYAAESGVYGRIEALFKAGADPSIADKAGRTASDYARDVKSANLIEDEIVRRGGNTPELIAARDKKRVTREFFDALSRGDLLDLPGLMLAGADPYATNAKGQNALTFAISQEHGSATAVLLAAGVDTNKADANADTPLYTAFKTGRTRTFGALLKNGASPDTATPEGESLLHTAIARSAGDFARILIENKADVTKPNKKGETPLAAAASAGGQAETIKALAQAGVSLDAQDADGNTLLMKSLRDGRGQTSWALIEAGADVTVKNAKGETALDFCAKYSGNYYNEIKKRADAARDKRIVELEEQVKQLGGDITKKPAAVVTAPPAAKPSTPGTP